MIYNIDYKKTINIILRCGLYIYIISRIFNCCVELNWIFIVAALKTMIDFFIVDRFIYYIIPYSDNALNTIGTILMSLNVLFFAYFYAKICGIYKLFKDFKLWQKSLIFIALSVAPYFVGMFDFKNLKLFDNFYFENNNFTIIYVSIFVFFAFILNLIFEFLTKKFPKPFEKIGYWVSIEFYKDLFKKIKNKK